MGITISGRKMTVDNDLKAYAEEKVGNALKVVDANSADTEVVLYREKNPSNPRPAVCEITVRVKGHIVRAEEHGEDLNAAIDVASAKVTRQLRKYKTRVVDKRIRTNEKQADAARNSAREESDLDLDQLMDELSNNEVVRVKKMDLTPMTEEEALVEMDLIGHDFFVYKDRDTDLICVLYRRKEGGFGKLQQQEEDR